MSGQNTLVQWSAPERAASYCPAVAVIGLPRAAVRKIRLSPPIQRIAILTVSYSSVYIARFMTQNRMIASLDLRIQAILITRRENRHEHRTENPGVAAHDAVAA